MAMTECKEMVGFGERLDKGEEGKLLAYSVARHRNILPPLAVLFSFDKRILFSIWKLCAMISRLY